MHTFSPYVVTAYQLEDSRSIKSSSKLMQTYTYFLLLSHEGIHKEWG